MLDVGQKELISKWAGSSHCTRVLWKDFAKASFKPWNQREVRWLEIDRDKDSENKFTCKTKSDRCSVVPRMVQKNKRSNCLAYVDNMPGGKTCPKDKEHNFQQIPSCSILSPASPPLLQGLQTILARRELYHRYQYFPLVCYLMVFQLLLHTLVLVGEVGLIGYINTMARH